MDKWMKPITTCNSCTRHLVDLCYKRSLAFRLFRAPLVAGMKIIARYHRIDLKDYPVRTERCRDCIRFMKNALKQKSPAFVRVNDMINPYFNRYRDSIVTKEEKARAKSLAAEFMDYESD
jgi:hypothetical protein